MNTKAIILSAVLACAVPAMGNAGAANVSEVSATAAAKKTLKTVTFNVSMHCENCAKKINENVGFEKGVKEMNISLDKKTVTITFDPAKTDAAKLKAAIEKLGYTATEVK